jgi:hypothetical protein
VRLGEIPELFAHAQRTQALGNAVKMRERD